MIRHFKAVLLLLISIFLSTGTFAQAQSLSEFLFGQRVNKNVFEKRLDIQSQEYLDSLVTNTPLKEKIGQLFFVPAEGRFTNRDSRSYTELKEMVEKHHIGGIIFMRGDIYGQAVMTN